MATDLSEYRGLQEELARLRRQVEELRGDRDEVKRRGSGDEQARIAAMFKAIYDQSSHPGGILGLDGKVLHANRASCELIGVDPSQVVGRLFWDTPWWTHSAAEQQRVKEAFLRACQGELAQFEGNHRDAFGRVRDMDVTLKPARDETGMIFCVISESREITERRRAEEELRANVSILRSVFRATPIGITFNINRVLQAVNDSMCELMGYTEQELLGQSARMFYATQEEFERVGREMYPEISRHGQVSVETSFRRKDGAAIQVNLTAAMLRPEDPSAGYAVTVQDITERTRAEQALRESEDRFRAMAEQSPLSFEEFSPDGDLVAVNPAFVRLWGVTRESLKGYNVLHDRQIESLGFMPVVRRAFMGEQVSTPVVDYDVSATLGSGEVRTVQGMFYPIRNGDGSIRSVILVHQDVTERIRAEKERLKLEEQLQQAMKMEAVGRLAGGIAHDFNNLLTAIGGNVELAKGEIGSTHPASPFLDEAFKAAESAASLTRQLLAFSRRQIIEPRLISLNDLALHTQGLLRRLIGEDIELQFVLGKNLGTVKVDPGQFEQVLVNLAVNSRDAMPNGGRLTVETATVELDADYSATHPQTQPGTYVMLAVSDSGHGMSDEVKKRVFEPFFTTKPKGRGTGLGLATIFGIVKQAGGTIEIYSEVGVGTSCKIYLPSLDTRPEALAADGRSHESVRGSETVLLVEDEANVRELARIALQQHGYSVLTASNGLDALHLAKQHAGRIDMLMTDVVLPGMNGRELSAQLLALRPGLKVLFTSGYTENVIVHHGVLDENLSFIGKPYSLDALAVKVREVLDQGPRTPA